MKNMANSFDSAAVKSLSKQSFDVCADLITQLRKETSYIPEMEYFFTLLKDHYDEQKKKSPKLIIFGTDFPMELAYAITGQMPFFVTGGSRILQEASDEMVPRDTDPVTRAALGALFANESWKATALVVIPCTSDAQRKVAYLLQSRGWKTVTLWIPAVKDEFTHKSFLSELDHAVRTMCSHVGRRYSVFALNRAFRYVQELRQELWRFLDAAEAVHLSGMLQMAIQNSFFMMQDPQEWKAQIRKLTQAVAAHQGAAVAGDRSDSGEITQTVTAHQGAAATGDRSDSGEITQTVAAHQGAAATGDRNDSGKAAPRVLVIGSPILFPNYKLPQLLLASGLEICGWIDCSTGSLSSDDGECKKGLEALAHYYFEHDSSSAFVQNEVLMELIRSSIKRYRPDGIIWHILKGQIEYDFELNHFEREAASVHGEVETVDSACPFCNQNEQMLPVIRLETDYQYQDIEQLRIRAEAFAELLAQKRKEHTA